MSRLFEGLEIRNRSLLTQQLGLPTANQNIANVNTLDVMRQREKTVAPQALSLPDGRNSTGVRVVSVSELRDCFLDPQLRREKNAQGVWESQKQILTQLELIFSANREDTVGDLMSGFWQSWQQLAANPSTAGRNAVLAQANLLIKAIHQTDSQLTSLEANINNELRKQVVVFNELGSQVASLNRQMASGELSGEMANVLRDRRNILVDELSKLAHIQVEETATGATNIYIGSVEFVNAHKVHTLKAVTTTDSTGMYPEIVWQHSGVEVRFFGGQVDALIQAREKWLPESREALGTLVKTLMTEVNALHRQGTTAEGRIGITFFDPVYTTPGSIQLHPAIADTSQQNIVVGRTGAESDVDIAQALADLAVNPVMPDGRTTLNEYYNSVVGTIGVRSSEAKDVAETQTLLVSQLENQRHSLMGASLDDELAKMVKSQHGYEAAARVISTMDEAIDTVIHGMGIVGR